MFGIVTKVVVGGVVVYGVAKVLQKTGIWEKITTNATDLADQVLTRIAEDPELQQLWARATSEKGVQ